MAAVGPVLREVSMRIMTGFMVGAMALVLPGCQPGLEYVRPSLLNDTPVTLRVEFTTREWRDREHFVVDLPPGGELTRDVIYYAASRPDRRPIATVRTASEERTFVFSQDTSRCEVRV